jgi:nicotinate-nucleotide pyrophosphorylase
MVRDAPKVRHMATHPGDTGLAAAQPPTASLDDHRIARRHRFTPDNHILAAGGVRAAFERVRDLDPAIPVQIEVDSIDALAEAIDAGTAKILIDNFDPDQMRQGVEYRDTHAPAARLEASGGLTLANASEVAATGVDWIAVGELTHSAPALDIGLDKPAQMSHVSRCLPSRSSLSPQ